MKSETFARIFLFVLIALAGFAGVMAAAPALGLPTAGSAGTVHELHARMPENGGWSLETINAQVGQPVRLRMTSDDVLHSFAIGQMDLEPVDLLPGEWHDLTLTFDKPGRYTYYCTRWCGRNHWRMRGSIIVTDPGQPAAADPGLTEKPLFLRLGLDLDAPHPAAAIPTGPTSAARGAALHDRLPAWALDRQTYLETAPADLWQRLRAEPSLKDLDDAALWDAVAYLLSRQTSPEALAAAAERFATNCAACHGETGRGDGVMVEDLPRFDPAKAHIGPASEDHTGMTPEEHAQSLAQPSQMAPSTMAPSTMLDPSQMGLSAPPDFTDPRGLLGASPALLEGKLLRGGMGTGMPYWGPIFTQEQLDGLVGYLYTFALEH